MKPTPSPELNETLDRFRDELFIPNSLKTNQQNLIYKRSNAHKLNEYPIIVAIGEEEESYQLRPLDKFALPTKQDSLRVLSLMAEANDWSNLATFLTGIYSGGQSLRLSQWEWLVRKAGGSKGLGALLMCAQQPESTHFRLKDLSLVERLFFELHHVGLRNDFKGKFVIKASGLARSFALLMESPEHAVHDLEKDPKRSTLVIGTLLELSAARALDMGGVDEGRVVEAYARRLLAGWKNQDTVPEGQEWVAIDHLLQTIVPSYNGMKLALQLNSIAGNKSIASGLKTRTNEFGMLIANLKKMAPKQVQEKPTIGLQHAQRLHQA